jgi:hypothetical protein
VLDDHAIFKLHLFPTIYDGIDAIDGIFFQFYVTGALLGFIRADIHPIYVQ